MAEVSLDPTITENELLKLLYSKRQDSYQEPAGIHLDPGSLTCLCKLSAINMNIEALIATADGYTWAGLPVTIELGSINVSFSKVKADQILTIRCVDVRSGRISYINHPDNPEGYK